MPRPIEADGIPLHRCEGCGEYAACEPVNPLHRVCWPCEQLMRHPGRHVLPRARVYRRVAGQLAGRASDADRR